MVSFADVVGGETGDLLNYYALYIVLLLSFGIVYYVGLFRVLYKLVQQVLVLTFMAGISALWYLLISKHLSHMQETQLLNTSATAYNALFNLSTVPDSELLKDALSEEEIIAPVSEMILITGTTIALLSWLYRQLPMDLIPDCIPCIGKYDNMLASLWLLFGVIVTFAGVYLQLFYVKKTNSSRMFADYFNGFNDNFRSFLTQPTDKQLNIVGNLSKDITVSLMKFGQMVKQSLVIILEKLQTALTKQEL